MITLSGFRQPAFSGMSSSTSVRNTYSTAAMQTARGALKLFGSCARGAGEVDRRRCASLAVDADRDAGSRAPLSSGSANSPSFSTSITRRTDFLGVVLHVAHVGLHDVEAEVRRPSRAAPARPSRWRRSAPAGRPCSARGCAPDTCPTASSATHLRLAQAPVLDQHEVVDQHALFLDRACESGGIEPGVMPPMSAWWPREPT